MKNKLLNLLFAGIILTSGLNAYAEDTKPQEKPKVEKVNPFNPKYYRRYKLEPDIGVSVNNVNFYLKGFDIDGDNDAEILETFPADSLGNKLSQYPFTYAFDKNNDGKFDENEILIDEKMDGFNGNEVSMITYIKRTRGI